MPEVIATADIDPIEEKKQRERETLSIASLSIGAMDIAAVRRRVADAFGVELASPQCDALMASLAMLHRQLNNPNAASKLLGMVSKEVDASRKVVYLGDCHPSSKNNQFSGNGSDAERTKRVADAVRLLMSDARIVKRIEFIANVNTSNARLDLLAKDISATELPSSGVPINATKLDAVTMTALLLDTARSDALFDSLSLHFSLLPETAKPFPTIAPVQWIAKVDLKSVEYFWKYVNEDINERSTIRIDVSFLANASTGSYKVCSL